MTFFVRFSFFGETFYGTQKQKDKPTIQGLFEDLLSKLYNTPIKVTISSRLDRFVNSLDFAISYVSPDESKISLDRVRYYLKRMLPKDVVLKDVRVVKDDFSARYSCSYKRYLYIIQNQKEKNPLFNRISYVPKKPIDRKKIDEILSLYEGTHDFRFFATPEEGDKTVLTLSKAYSEERDGFLLLRFQGQSFLRYEIRFLVGTALEYGDDKISKDTILSLLNGKEVPYIKYKAEPQGLLLERIFYPDFDAEETF